ncbi:unnamed protein product [Rotaria magnacalcarata]|uniref:RBR-type E3 ubiquitin transferase n=1 Tax=Rotaria magnacalcarata TaxID=392030 RepID=A0A815FI13_9BILA|nr:unnamed protein product [Rotaria magnacalcarata]CAF4702154.1 unnamed protein product [Rotaria magnacalcarata]
MTPRIRRVTTDALLSISLDNININLSKSYDSITKSININNLQQPLTSSTSTSSSSSKISNNHSLRSYSVAFFLKQDDDDASSNDDDLNHQWDLHQQSINIQSSQLNIRKIFQLWAEKLDKNQHYAQKCPNCKIYISRNGGGSHMICTKCQCNFCYNCGKRRFGIKFLGLHESRFSPFECKYNFYPDKPLVRHTVHGLVAGAASLAIPIAAVALLAVGTTIGAPTHGTYRLFKHIRSKRQQQRHQKYHIETISKQWNINHDNDQNIEYNVLEKSVKASLITYKEEIKVTLYPNRHLNQS